MKLSKTGWIFLLAGVALAVVGFLFSDEEKYPVAAKFSAVMIIVGLLGVGFATATVWNPVKAI